MSKFNRICTNFRVVSFLVHRPFSHICVKKYRLQIVPAHSYIHWREMAQKSITSFFKITPKKSAEEHTIQPERDGSFSNDEVDSKESPVSSGSKSRSSKRVRSDSEEPASPTPAKRSSSPASSEKKKKVKRQRIESSESEAESPKKAESPIVEKLETNVEVARAELKTYQSPKTKKAKGKSNIKKEIASPEAKENISVNGKNASPKTVKEEKVTPKGKKKTPKKSENKSPLLEAEVKEEISSPEDKKSTDNEKDVRPSPTKESNESPPKKKNAFMMMTGKATKKENGFDSEVTNQKVEGLVAEEDYNPAKSKYHPIDDACWRAGQPVPYLALARTLELVEGTSARLRMVDIVANYLRSVVALTPDDLLPSIYLCLNQLAPAYHSIELGIAETYLMKAVAQCTGRTLAQVRTAARADGDLGRVAEAARAAQRTMFAVSPLAVRKVFGALKEIALMTGHASVNKKIAKIQSLYVACRHAEARYLIRSLEGKLRVGLAEQSLLQALAVALASDPPGQPPAPVEPGDKLKARIEQYALIIKTTYCECPNYELVVAALLKHGVPALPEHCRLTPGIPLKPMLAHPTKGVLEVFNRFEKEEFTCEYKYDGERAQIHVPARAGGGPDLPRAAIFSRNQEDNTGKYPDILGRLDSLLGADVESCVLDCEAVAYDPATKQILPFQVLSTRKRKGAAEAGVRVQVCVFVFDLLYLNGRALVREPLAERRRLLREHLRETEGVWQFAAGQDCSTAEEVAALLEAAVRGSCEGLMVKTLRGDTARYDIARRSRNWLKLKKDYLEGVGDTLDVVVIGGYLGRGRRAGVYGGFLLACHDPAADEFQSLCKIGTGFSDEDLTKLSETLQKHVIDAPPNYYRYDSSHAPDAWFAAACVWEVRCADLSLSPAHRAAAGLAHPSKGVSLRFPRFVRVREDKSPEQATSARQVADLYLAQDQVRNAQGSGPALADDDFY